MVGAGHACFGIIYLYPDQPTIALLSYGICVPDLATPFADGLTLDASWTGTLAKDRRATPPWRPDPR
jgi:hypothetical protein